VVVRRYSTIPLDKLADFRVTSLDNGLKSVNLNILCTTQKGGNFGYLIRHKYEEKKGNKSSKEKKASSPALLFIKNNPDHVKMSHHSLDELGLLDLNVTVS
jgi:hypothetical protein